MRCECRVRVHDQIREMLREWGAKTIDDKKNLSEQKRNQQQEGRDDYGLEASKVRSSPTHSVHIVWTLRAFSSNGRIVSGVNDNPKPRLSIPSCGIRVGVGGGADRTEPVSVLPRRVDAAEVDLLFVGRRGLLLLPLTILVVALVDDWLCSLSSCTSADSSTFDRRVGRKYDVTCESGSGRGGVCGCGEEVVGGEAVATSETCEREAVDGDSAQIDSED
jgi:hypothetical protein